MGLPSVIFEDKYIIVLNKPSGWIVNKAKTTKGQPVLQEWLETLNYPLAHDEKTRSGIVHRLDKETSGILVVAKDVDTLAMLQQQFKKRLVRKKYKALLQGKLEPKKGEVDVPVGRLSWSRTKFGVVPGGRASYTQFKVISYYKKDKNEYTLADFFPKTGRTHQIRIHAKYLNHPIVGDDKYSGRKRSKLERKWCPRIFLHAEMIEFSHPKTHKKVNYECKLPSDLTKALSGLEKLG